ncbi:propionate CoA-transferase [Eubacterium aggregans]|uniref:Propionate CoA-transferase n=1 Tax=Eubacterium aggregans TaxID=81409 RepID=A0A1H3XTJ3_9FIRM|nr:CoA-transferase [Eubacterium aggregans]SEA02633.1 propionate CoA-transferase [Eubacterium aggregans]
MQKKINAQRAASLIKNNDTIAISGFAFGFGFAEEIVNAVEKRFLSEGEPHSLTLIFGSGCGDAGKSNAGLDHFAHEGMVKRIIAGHIGLARKLSQMIFENKIEAYNLPQGTVTHLFREIAAGRPGVITHVGLETYVDPKLDGGRMNTATTEDYVKLIDFEGEKKLFYPSIPINVAIIRGTTADEFGNLSADKEGVLLEAMPIAQATKNSGGIVIAQAEKMGVRGSLDPRNILVPGIMVDAVVIALPNTQHMNFGTPYDPSFTGDLRLPTNAIQPMPQSVRRVIAKRCAMELSVDSTINLGIGVPEGIAQIANEEGTGNRLVMTIEAGAVGGIPGSGFDLGASANVEAIIGQPNIFDYYDGGGLDQAFLGLAQADAQGNINVSKFNGRMVGCGGFINITQNTKKVIFCGTFTAGKSDITISEGQLTIHRDGTIHKFVKAVEQITFSGSYAKTQHQEVLYITERAVFQLGPKGLELTEIAPGIDLDLDILQRMDFSPLISKDLKIMDPSIFSEIVLPVDPNESGDSDCSNAS